jgi:hypothetical protein
MQFKVPKTVLQGVAEALPTICLDYVVHRQHCALLGAVDAGFQVNQPVCVALRRGCERKGLVTHGLFSTSSFRSSYPASSAMYAA